MKTCVVLYSVLLAAADVHGQGAPWKEKTVELKRVRPFRQPESMALIDLVGVMFKPQVYVSEGCNSYPAVNSAGETTSGRSLEGTTDIRCKKSKHYSQVYGRCTWHRNKWAIMYAWHFPRYEPNALRHDWEHVVVWLDNPAAPNRTLEAVSVWDDEKREYTKAVPPESEFVDGSSVKLELEKGVSTRTLRLTSRPGQFQSLVTWDQLPNNTRRALNAVVWGTMRMPLSESRFTFTLDNAWPFDSVAPPPPP